MLSIWLHPYISHDLNHNFILIGHSAWTPFSHLTHSTIFFRLKSSRTWMHFPLQSQLKIIKPIDPRTYQKEWQRNWNQTNHQPCNKPYKNNRSSGKDAWSMQWYVMGTPKELRQGSRWPLTKKMAWCGWWDCYIWSYTSSQGSKDIGLLIKLNYYQDRLIELLIRLSISESPNNMHIYVTVFLLSE